MEYAIPAELVADAVRALDQGLAEQKLFLAFPVDIRFSAREDDVWLSPAYGQDVAWVGIPAKRPYGIETPHTESFRLFEDVMMAHRGRTHWAKQHTTDGKYFEKVYPRWHDFLAVRQRLDPDGVFLNAHLRRLFCLEAPMPTSRL